MKRLLLMGFAACALVMTSCSEQEITENITDGLGQLSFSAGIGKQSATRGAELNNDTLRKAAGTNGITLYAYQNESSTWKKWYNDTVVYKTGQWGLKNSVRFRNANASKYITYFSTVKNALVEVKEGAPGVEKSTFETADFKTGKYPAFSYKVAANSAVQEDLIAGITEVRADETDITLGMRHILSQVNFGTVGYKGAKIQIQNIKIVGVGDSATFTYKAENTYPIGEWSVPATKETEYSYYNYSNTAGATDNTHTLVPATANKGDVYIFGDGGNWGPGKAATTWYPVGTSPKWENVAITPQTGLKNSLMLLPQVLTENAKVTFEYRIQDVSDAYVAGNASTWAKGEFALNFKTGTVSGKHYLGQWEQNYRYVYLIDFTDFLDGAALTFNVDVDMYEWENYNQAGDDDGIVDIVAAGRPTEAKMNAATFTAGDTWYIASQSETAPNAATPFKWAQVVRDESWDMSAYDFTSIAKNGSFMLSFQHVIFNTTGTSPVPTVITMTLPDGFEVTAPMGYTNITIAPHATLSNTWNISKGDTTAAAKITITNKNYYRTSADLKTNIEAATSNGVKFGYGGTTNVDLTKMKPNLSDGGFMTVKFNTPVKPTVGVVDESIWTWNNVTQTATWMKSYSEQNTLQTVIKAVTADGMKFGYIGSEAIDLTGIEPSDVANIEIISVLFNSSVTPSVAGTTNGTWTWNNTTKTATWTKNTP